MGREPTDDQLFVQLSLSVLAKQRQNGAWKELPFSGSGSVSTCSPVGRTVPHRDRWMMYMMSSGFRNHRVAAVKRLSRSLATKVHSKIRERVGWLTE